MTAVHRVDDSTVCAGRKNGVATDGENAQPDAAEFCFEGEEE
jgi:hypothetical protein